MRSNVWWRIGLKAWRLGLEAGTVLTLRTVKIMSGGQAGQAEARLMITEKLDAGGKLQARALAGKLGASPQTATLKTLKHYGSKVRANRLRLGRSGKPGCRWRGRRPS